MTTIFRVLAVLLSILLVSAPRIAAAAPQKPETPPAKTAGAAAGSGAASGQSGAGGGWMTWRGPLGSGEAPQANPPTEWSEEKNVRWKVEVPGKGHSTPIVVGDRIYLTTAIETDVEAPESERPEPPPERAGRGQGGRRGGRGRRGRGGRLRVLPPPTKYWEFHVLALDRKTGKTVWKTKVKREVPHEGGHGSNSQASASPVTDGAHIYAFFGSRGLFCLGVDGKVKWSKDLGDMVTRRQFGEGASPALHGNTLVVNWDHEGDSFIVALDKRDGKELWRQPRDESSSWGTPLIVDVEGKPQVIVTGRKASLAYDLKTGKPIWSCTGMTGNCIPTPIHRDGVAYLMSGWKGAALQAIKLDGARGKLDDTEHVVWSHSRNTSYVPSALLYGKHLYFVRSMNGVLSCLEAETGEVCYEGKRLPGIRSVYASPVGAGGRVYLASREGVTKVIAAGPEFEDLATNELDDGFDASPVVVGDQIFLRGTRHLYCIAE